MMRTSQWLPFFLMLLGFLPYFFKSVFVGADTYYFANYACGIYDDITATGPLSKFLFKHLCLLYRNPILGKLLLLAIALLSTFIVYTELGSFSTTFLFLAPVWITEFWKFEDDQLSFPLLFLSWKFWRKKRESIALVLAVLASLIWRGAVVWVLFYGIQGFPPAVILSLPIIPKLVPHFLPDARIQERTPGFAILLWMLALGGIFEMNIWGWFWIIIGLLNAKWSLWAVPFLAEGVGKMYRKLSKDRKALLWIILAITVIGTAFSVFRTWPTKDQWRVIHEAVRIANGSWICGDWDLGYWIDWAGGRAWAHGGPGEECWEGIIVTRKDLNIHGMAAHLVGRGKVLKIYQT